MNELKPIGTLPRDGTSRQDRRPDTLDPSTCVLDDRSLAEQLAYIRSLAGLLHWYNDADQKIGTWDRLIGDDGDALAAYAADPSAYPPELARDLAPAHRILVLVVLRLLGLLRERLNRLPARHREFYQREVLRLRPAPAQPDRVHLLVEPAVAGQGARLPKGSPVTAGRDQSGRELRYVTEHDLFVGRARVAALRSLFTEQQLTDPATVRRDPELTPKQRFMKLLGLALGEPGPGDAIRCKDWAKIDYDLVTDTLGKWLELAGRDPPLGLELFELRELMTLREQLTGPESDKEWKIINEALTAIGKRRTEDEGFTLRSGAADNPKSREFLPNLLLALGLEKAPTFEGLPDVDDLDELYERYEQYDRQGENGHESLNEIVAYLSKDQVLKALLEPNGGRAGGGLARDFRTMMQQKQTIERRCERIRELLDRTDNREALPCSLLSGASFEPSVFKDNLDGALPSLDAQTLPALDNEKPGSQIPVGSVAVYWEQIEAIESWACMPAESLRYLIQHAPPALDPEARHDPGLWARIDRLLLQARAEKSIQLAGRDDSKERRNTTLKEVYEEAQERNWHARDILRALLSAALDRPSQDSLEAMPDLEDLAQDAERELQQSPEQRAQLRAYVGQLGTDDAQAQPSDTTWEDTTWEELIALAERVMRVREVGPAELVSRDWINLHAFADAETARVSGSFDAQTSTDAEDHPRWRTFGAAPDTAAPETPTPPLLGWALASPILAMAQGRRRIDLTLTFDRTELTKAQREALEKLFHDAKPGAKTYDAPAGPLAVQLSSADAWVDLAPGNPDGDLVSVKLKDTTSETGEHQLMLQLVLVLLPSAPAIEAPNDALGVGSPWPVLRLMPRLHWDSNIRRFRSRYRELRALRLLEVRCTVTIGVPSPDPKAQGAASSPPTEKDPGKDTEKDPEDGLTEPLLRNDDGLLDPSKPFEPFGLRPVTGSRLAIAHPELAVKRIDKLWLDLTWHGLPDTETKAGSTQLDQWYSGYCKEAQLSNDDFKVSVTLVDRRTARRLVELDENGKPTVLQPTLFEKTNAQTPHRITINDLDAKLDHPPCEPAELDAPDPTQWPRFLRLELLSPDLQHTAFLSEAISSGGTLNPPYTPQLKTLSIGYRASTHWPVPSGQARGVDAPQLLHIHPFGFTRLNDPGDETPAPLRFLPSYEEAGCLYIGLADLAPPQRISLLLQLADGSADPDLPAAAVQWSRLDADRWVALEQGQLLRDETRGLINTGIVDLALPPVAPSTLMPAGLYWLRVSVTADPRACCDAVAIATNGVRAVLDDRGNDPQHYTEPLAPERIRSLLRPIAGIGPVAQPYSSFGGRPAESDDALAVRAAERLRHRRRAVNAWDYERLVLQRFPQLYKVKCIPAQPGGDSADLGTVRIIVIPDIRKQQPSDPFAPKAPADLLADIRRFLAEQAPASARIQVRNAVFVPIRVRVGIRFHDGYDPRIARAELIDGLKRLLSPWAFEPTADIVIGGAIYANSLIDFLERQPAVDYVQYCRLYRLRSTSGSPVRVDPPSDRDPNADGYHVRAEGPDQVLVTAGEHFIDAVGPDIEGLDLFRGIGYMRVQVDFEVAPSPIPQAAS